MDKYFRAVGFSQLKAGRQLDALIQDSFRTCESKYATGFDSDNVLLDCFKYFGKGIGLGLSGVVKKNKSVSLRKCFPFAESDCRVDAVNVEVEDAENDKLIMFYDKKTYNQFVVKLQKPQSASGAIRSVSVSALSAKGKILLPFFKDAEQDSFKKKESAQLKKLMRKVCAGDKKAEVKLDECMDGASLAIRGRMLKEDFFSIIETYFEPNDENDFSYDILAEIISSETVVNSATEEKLYKMTIDVAGTRMQLYINHNDLVGLPSAGMRFWGVCALSGSVVNKKKLLSVFKGYLSTGGRRS